MKVREQPIEERKIGNDTIYILYFTFYLTHPVTEHIYSDVYATTCTCRKYGRCKLQEQNTFRLHAAVVFVEPAKENSKLVLLLILGLFLPLILFPLTSHIFLYTKPFVVFSVLGFSGSG